MLPEKEEGHPDPRLEPLPVVRGVRYLAGMDLPRRGIELAHLLILNG